MRQSVGGGGGGCVVVGFVAARVKAFALNVSSHVN